MSAPSFPIATEDGVCVAQIDTKIPGSVESVDGAANWLELLRDGFHDARTMFSSAATLANADLSGELADAVVAYSNDLHDACNDAYDRAKNAADVIRSFADQLGWRQDDMVEHRETARAGGMEVIGAVIVASMSVPKPADLGSGTTAAEKKEWVAANNEYEDHQTRRALFEEVKGAVQDTFDKLDGWIAEYLVTVESDTLRSVFMGGVKGLVESAFGEGSKVATENVYHYKATALYAAAVAAATEKAVERSGNPAVRAGNKSPNEDNINRYLKRTPKMDAVAQVVEVGEKAVKVAGVTVTLGFIGADLASGRSPSGVLLPAAVSATAAVLLPASASIGVVIAVPAAAAFSAGYLYENYVSLETREKIDEGLHDMWDWRPTVLMTSPTGGRISGTGSSDNRGSPRLPLGQVEVSPHVTTCEQADKDRDNSPWWLLAAGCSCPGSWRYWSTT